MFRMIVVLALTLPAYALAGERRMDFHIGCASSQGCLEMPYWDGSKGSIWVGKEPLLSISEQEISGIQIGKGEIGQEQVSLQLGPEAAERFAGITLANLHKTLAVVVDGRVWIAPSISAPIQDGRISFTLAARSGAQALAELPWLEEMAKKEREKKQSRDLHGLLAFSSLALALIAAALFYGFFRRRESGDSESAPA